MGWITADAIANVTTLLVSINWKGFGFQYPAIVYTVITCIVFIIITLVYVIGKKVFR